MDPGYLATPCTVQTSDGFILGLFRLSANKQITSSGKVVFLLHGFGGLADHWTVLGPGRSIAYLLVDEGEL